MNVQPPNKIRQAASERCDSVDEGAERELTVRAVMLGLLLALILGAANAYLGLLAGMTVSASIPAAVVSMAILQALGGRRSSQTTWYRRLRLPAKRASGGN